MTLDITDITDVTDDADTLPYYTILYFGRIFAVQGYLIIYGFSYCDRVKETKKNNNGG